MLSTFIGAGLARGTARSEHRTRDISVVASVTGKDFSRGHADIDAVEAAADAVGKLGDHLFTEAGICARSARLSALKARLDAFREFGFIDVPRAHRVGVRHRLYVCHWYLFPGLFSRSWCD